MSRSIDGTMSRLCGRFMSCAQNALDAQNYALEEMEYLAEQNPDREDIRACIDELKQQNKASESANWATADHWSEHFDGIDAGDGNGGEETGTTDESATEEGGE